MQSRTPEETQQLVEIANQFHIIAHALLELDYIDSADVFATLYSELKCDLKYEESPELSNDAFTTCGGAEELVDSKRSFEEYKADALTSVEKFKKLPEAEKYKELISKGENRLNNPNTMFGAGLPLRLSMVEVRDVLPGVSMLAISFRQ